MKKKILSLALVVAMIAIIAAGSLAYFTDTEEVTNNMTIGNVDIEINELMMTENGWVVYEDGSDIMYPLANEKGIVQYNKYVRTKNISESGADVYIRSIVLIEANDRISDAYTTDDCCFPGIHYGYNNSTAAASDGKSTQYGVEVETKLEDTVEIGDVNYWVVSFVSYDDAKISKDSSLCSLHSVWIDESVTSEEAAGWGDDGVQVIAFSQAIQAEGLEHDEAMEALGEVNADNIAKWIG